MFLLNVARFGQWSSSVKDAIEERVKLFVESFTFWSVDLQRTSSVRRREWGSLEPHAPASSGP